MIREGKHYGCTFTRNKRKRKRKVEVETPSVQEGDSVTDLRAGGLGRGLGHVIQNRGAGPSAWAHGPCD